MTGTVKWFDTARGFGFVRCGDGKEIFVHIKAVTPYKGDRNLYPNDSLSFDVKNTDKGERAINVRVERRAPQVARTHNQD